MEAVKESNTNLEIDSEALGRYLSLINTEEILRTSGIDPLCQRKKLPGFRVIVKSNQSPKTRGKGPSRLNKDKWDPPSTSPDTPNYIRLLMAVVS